MRKQLASTPLFWRVFWGNAAVLVVVVVVLVFGPLQIVGSVDADRIDQPGGGRCPRARDQPRAHASGVPAVRRAGGPRCAGMTRCRPASASHVEGGPEVTALAQTFNEMLDRLESERRESARRALIVQEGERRRIARELHDEVGQTLTGVMLQVEGLAARIPEELRERARRAARDRAQRRRGRTADRAPAAARGARGPRAAERARRAGHRVRRAGACPRRPPAGSRPAALRGAGAGHLPRRAGGADQRRPARGARRASSCDSSSTDADRADRARRRASACPPRRDSPRTASAACASARC